MDHVIPSVPLVRSRIPLDSTPYGTTYGSENGDGYASGSTTTFGTVSDGG
jgi:hypothetical protein